MEALVFAIVVGSSLWMAFDVHQSGYYKTHSGTGPIGWFFGGLLLWIVVFPLYLAKRGKLKAGASAQSPTPSGGPGQMAESFNPQGTEPDTGGGETGVSPLRQRLNMAVGIFFGGWAVLALAWNLIGSEPDQSPGASSSEPARAATEPASPAQAASPPAVQPAASPTGSSGEVNICETMSSDEIALALLPLMYPGGGPDDDRLMGCAVLQHADVVRKSIKEQCDETARTGWVAGQSNKLLLQSLIWTMMDLDESGKCNGG